MVLYVIFYDIIIFFCVLLIERMKNKFMLNSNLLIIVLLTALVVLAVYAIFFKGSCGCGKVQFSNTIKLEIYTAPWCGFCKQFEQGGTIQKIKDKLGADNVMHYVEGEANTTEKMRENGVQGFPTIMVTGNGKKVVHNGERTVDSVCDFYNSNL